MAYFILPVTEIAEYHLKSVLKKLDDQEFKVVFVFDELDKIENSDDMINLISDLKPMLLSNLASFIVISGQKMYYRLQSSNLLEDSLLSSIFSKNIHVPLVIETDLDKLFDEIIFDKSVNNEKLIRTYKKSVILNSNGTLRRFINRLLQDVIWIDEKAYIEVEVSNATKYETDSKILSVLNYIIENQIEINEYDVGIKDFLIYQLYLWIKRMKIKGNVYFTLSEIFDFNNDYSDDYHLWYEVELTELCNELIMKLVSEELLESKDSEGDKFFRWVLSADVSISSLVSENSNIKFQYLHDFVELEELAREILTDLNIENGMRVKSLRNIIEILVRNNIVNNKWLNEDYMTYINLSNRIRHGEKLSDVDMNKISLSRLNSMQMKSELIEGYSKYVISKCLITRNYEVLQNPRFSNRESMYEFDVIAKHIEKDDIIFEIKYWSNLKTSNIRNTLDKLINQMKNHSNLTNKKNKFILLIFSSQVDPNMLIRINDTIKSIMLEDMSMPIRVLIVSRNGKIFDSSRIVEFLESFEAQ